MLGPIGNPAYRGYMADIVSSGRHLSLLLSDMLDLARIESGNLALSPEAVRLDAILRDCLGTVSPADLARLQVGDLAPAKVVADPRAAQQVFANLLSNALAFSGRDEAVTVALQPSESGWVLAVSDRGVAIAADQLSTLADPFSLETGSALIAGRAGPRIGLAVASRLCDALGWQLAPESRQDEGTTVRVSIPA